MAVETVNYWPVLTSTPPRENTLQRDSVSRIPSRDHQCQSIHGNRIEIEPAPYWEKGTFIDIYS
jgi:hypothetical protein